MSRLSPPVVSLLLLIASVASAQPVFVYTNADGDQLFSNAANWTTPEGFSAPPATDGSAIIRAQPGASNLVLPSGTVDFDSLLVDNVNNFGATIALDSKTSTSVGFANGLNPTTFGTTFGKRAAVYFLESVDVRIDTNQTWDVIQVNVMGSVGGTGRLTFDPASSATGSLYLAGANQFNGGLTVRDSYLTLEHADALAGAGAYEFRNVRFESAFDLDLNNAVTLGGSITFNSYYSGASYRVSGPITLDGSISIETYENGQGPVSLAGPIGESTPSALVLTGGEVTIGDSATMPTSTYTGGTTVSGGRLYFLNAEAVPATGEITSTTNGYVGAAFSTGVQDAFLARLSSSNFKGTIGFDTAPGSGLPNNFTNVNLSMVDPDFYGVGSSTKSTLTGTFIRGSTVNYQFGGGGGTLYVQSALDDSTAGLLLRTNDDPLRLVLQGNNSFGGNVTINGGALVLDGPNALPAGAMVAAGAGTANYFGATENSPLGLADLASRLSSSISNVMLGLDSADINAPRTLTTPVDLSFGGLVDESYTFGTSNALIVNTTIDPAASDGSLYLAAFGGQLTINAPITSAVTDLHIGNTATSEINGTVALNAANTHTGQTYLDAGELSLGHANALSTEALVVTGGYEQNAARLSTSSNLAIANDIIIGNDLALGRSDNANHLELSGHLRSLNTYNAQFRFQGAGELTLSGSASDLTLYGEGTPDSAIRLGGDFNNLRLNLHSGSAIIEPGTQTLGGLSTEEGTTTTLSAGSVLRFNGSNYGESGLYVSLAGQVTGDGSLLFDANYGTLELWAANSFTGGIDATGVDVRIGDSGALGTGSLRIQGSTNNGVRLFAVNPDIVLNNAIILDGLLEIGDYYYSQSEAITLAGIISGNGILRVQSETTLAGANTFGGELRVSGADLILANNRATGMAMLRLDGDFYEEEPASATFETAAPVLAGLSSEDSTSAIHLADGSNLTIDAKNDDIYEGSFNGTNASLTKTGPGTLEFGGMLNLDAGVTVSEGNFIFGSTSSLGSLNGSTSNRLVSTGAGYIGLSDDDFSVSAFLARFDPTLTDGAIGFDTLHSGSSESEGPFEPLTISSAINLGLFNANVRLSSATSVILDPGAIITPAGDANAPYRFGNGGGLLVVQSLLTGDRGVVGLSAPENPLIVILDGANTFTGDVSANHTGFIFGRDALPATATFDVQSGGYFGSADPGLSPNAFLARFDPTLNHGIIGFDRIPENFDDDAPRLLIEDVDFTRFTGATLPIFGTASDLIVRGQILTNPDATLRLAGFSTGNLSILSQITGAGTSVQIGDPSLLSTYGDRSDDMLSTVALLGANTYGGGTTLYTGRLEVSGDGTASGLGTGALVVQPHDFIAEHPALLPELAPGLATAILPNAIELNTDLAIATDYDSRLSLDGTISGSGGLHLAGQGVTRLSGANTYTGGTMLESGRVVVASDQAFGTGVIEFTGNSAEIHAVNGPRTINNLLRLSSDNYGNLAVLGDDLTLSGGLDIEGDNQQLYVPGDVFLTGPVSGSGNANLDGSGRIWISNTDAFTGGISSGSAHLIFTDTSALGMARSGDNLLGNGYIGLATVPDNLQADFLSLFDPGYYNTTIGFDTLPGQITNVFTDAINLLPFAEYFNEMTIGTSTFATLAGDYTPSGNTYRIGGNSRGWLTLAMDLENDDPNETSRSFSLSNNSNTSAFVVRLTGDNNYSGSTYVQNAALLFASAGALSPSTTFSSGSNAYFGVESPALSFDSLLAVVPTNSGDLLLGVDTADVATPRTLTSPNLGVFDGTSSVIALGTTSAAVIDGTITLPNTQSVYRFFGYGGGQLTVNSILSGSQSVEIGERYTNATTGNTGLGLPSVTLNGTNTYTGGTNFYGGRLVLGDEHALGTGDLTISTFSGQPTTRHSLVFNTGAIANNISLYNDITLGASVADVTLSGSIFGNDAVISIEDAVTLHLSGDNTFGFGEFALSNGNISFEGPSSSVGMSNTLSFRNQGGTASFSTANPMLGGLRDEGATTANIALASGTTLQLNINDRTAFGGTISGDGALQKSGESQLALTAVNTYTGGTTISSGILHAGNAQALGTGAITLDGGRLSIAPGVTFNNAFSFGTAGGRLGGNGTFTSPVTLGANSGLAPGESVGALTFTSDLTWAGGAFFDLEVEDAYGTAGSGYDTVTVGGTLTLSATMANPFLINLMTINNGSGPTLDFDNTNYYAWTLVSAGSIAGFDAAAFTINTSAFDANLGGLGNFFVSANDTTLFVNFTPVPEPSTAALMGLGLTILGFHGCRRRRRHG